MSNENMVHVGIYFPKETLKKVDERKGKYYSRNKYFLKIVEEHLSSGKNGTNESKGVRGSYQVTNQRATSTTPTPTPESRRTNSLINNWRSCAW